MKFIINDNLTLDEASLGEGRILEKNGENYRFLYKNVNYNVRIVSYDESTKTYKLKINGYTLTIKKENELDQLINQLGFNKPPKVELKQIIAPMPGLVKDILAKEGDAIVSGSNLLILEAMKMENILKSNGDGVITSIEVKIGDKVDKGTILMKL